MTLYKKILRPLLFRSDPERVLDALLGLGEFVEGVPFVLDGMRGMFTFEDPRLRVRVSNLLFPNPVGLAAGFDKNGRVVQFLASLEFGFTEIGSVSYDFSKGNPKPRLFRLPLDEAVAVYYGLPNEGAYRVHRRLQGKRARLPVPLSTSSTRTVAPTALPPGCGRSSMTT